MKVVERRRMKTNTNILLAVAVIIFLLFNANSWRKQSKEQGDLIEVLGSELITWKNENGMNHAKIRTLTTQKTQAFLKIKSQDSNIIELQNLVKTYKKELKKGGSVTVIKTVTKHDTIYRSTNNTIFTDFNTFVIDTFENIWMKTSFGFKFKEISEDGNFKIDSVRFNLKIRNSYSVIIGSEKTKWYGKRKSFVEVINKNPYSSTIALRTYEVATPVPKRIGLGPVLGYGFSNGFQPELFVGFGLQYNLIQF